MATQSSRALAQQYFDMWNKLEASAADSVLAADVVGHVNGATLHGTQVFKDRVAALSRAWKPARFHLEDMVAENDKILIRWRFEGTNSGPTPDHEATGKSVNVTGMNLFRVHDGKIVELWVNADDLGEMQQLGLAH